MTLPEPLTELVGAEHSVRGVAQALHHLVSAWAPPTTGAMLVTCADESEHECAAAFHTGFSQFVLPDLKMAHNPPFRLANLGGRYEWGAGGVAEDHFACADQRAPWKLMVVKVNAHVGVISDADGERFGKLERFGVESACCGALGMVLAGTPKPFAKPLEEALRSEGVDRIALLRDETKVDPRERALCAALVSARLQARTVMLDVQDHTPATPTLWLVLPCVTLNRPGPDTEILVGGYVADQREEDGHETWFGLGSDPTAFRLTREHGRLRVSDPESTVLRPARDHRALALSHARERASAHRHDERLQRLRQDVAENRHHHHEHGRLLLKAALVALAEVAPVPAALLLFGYGAVGIHHAFTMHRLAREQAEHEDAREILEELHDRVDGMHPEEAQALLESLVAEPSK